MEQPKKRLFYLVRKAIIWRKHYSKRTKEAYIHWIKPYIFFQNKRHPLEKGNTEIEVFLTYLAIKKRMSASTQQIILSDRTGRVVAQTVLYYFIEKTPTPHFSKLLILLSPYYFVCSRTSYQTRIWATAR
jgi:hypothetical protein